MNPVSVVVNITSPICLPIRHVTLVTIAGTTILVPYRQVKWLQLIWRSGTRTRRFHLRVPDLQMNCRNVTTWQGIKVVATSMAAARVAFPLKKELEWYCWSSLDCNHFSPQNSQNTFHISPVRVRHGVSFVSIIVWYISCTCLSHSCDIVLWWTLF